MEELQCSASFPPASMNRSVDPPQMDWVSPHHRPTSAPILPEPKLHIGTSAAVERIQQKYLARVNEVRQACQAAVFEGNPRNAIEKVIDLVGLDECMVHAMSRATGRSREEFDDQRLLRRCDIDVLLKSADQINDRHSKLLGEILLDNLRRYRAAALKGIGQAALPGF